jgi:hypothetical protein
MHFTLRSATPCDADAIANVYSTSFRLLTFLPVLHTIEDYRWFIANVILKECEVTVVEDQSGIVAFLARQGEEVRLLYTRPDQDWRTAGFGADLPLLRRPSNGEECPSPVIAEPHPKGLRWRE